MTSATVVIPTRGGAHRLPRLLTSLAAQTHPDWNVVIVVDGDIDGSEQVVAGHPDLPVRCIVLPSNAGRATALNTGFAAADGEVLIRADDDFELAPGHIAAHVRAHELRACGAIGLPLNIAPDNAYMRAYGTDADERGRRGAYATAPDARWRYWGGNTSVTREVYDRVGGFDLRYRGYGWEDVDFGYRVHQLQIPIVLLPDAAVRHHMAAVDTRARVERSFHSGQARSFFEGLHGPGTTGAASGATSLWERLTDALGRHLDERSSVRAASAVDRALPYLPRPLGRKAVAVLVESSVRAGFRIGRPDD